MQNTTFTKPAETSTDWYHVSAKNEVLGRLAVRIARVLLGKHKRTWSPNIDNGDFVIVTDASSVTLTRAKAVNKVYRYHTGFAGGLKEVSYGRLRSEKPDQMLMLAVKRMMPKNRLGRQVLKKLKVYAGVDHPHAAQQPKPLP
jgi:large subunit ribosomal protein L13